MNHRLPNCSWLAFGIFLSLKALMLTAVLSLSVSSVSHAGDERSLLNGPSVGTTFAAQDTLDPDQDPDEDASECLAGLRWNPGPFEVRCESAQENLGDLLLRFPSPLPTGDAVNDNVSVEWYFARNDQRELIQARSIIVVHESGRGMTVGRIFARGLATQGLHTFLVHMPGYGARRSERSGSPELILTSMKQAVADVRRARDVAVRMPLVDETIVGIQGTSLGGFITSTVAGMDHGFDRVFILLAGGNLHEVVLNGQRDAAKVRERLASIGVTGDQIRELSRPVEPLRLAHRLDPQNTWLYSGKYDDVVPPACSFALASAAKLPEGHHIEMPADHYSGVIFLPMVITEIRKNMLADVAAPNPPACVESP